MSRRHMEVLMQAMTVEGGDADSCEEECARDEVDEGGEERHELCGS